MPEPDAKSDGGVEQSMTWMTPSGVQERMNCSGAMARRIEETFVTVEQLLDAIEDDELLTSVEGIGPVTAGVIEDWYENREQREREAKSATVERTSSKSFSIKNNGDWSGALGIEVTEEDDA